MHTQIDNYISTEILINFPKTNITKLYKLLLSKILKDFNTGVLEGEDNFVFEITTEEEQQNALNGLSDNNHSLSIIDLGECKNLLILWAHLGQWIIVHKNVEVFLETFSLGGYIELMKKYFSDEKKNISLIILKCEKIANISNERNIQYEIFEPYNATKLDLSICDQEMINIYIPVQLSDSIENLIEELKELGYDIFNINDPFYQDICTKYTSVVLIFV